MKRLIFCFDGTWNALNADTPTNIVLTAASIVRSVPGGPTQIIHYDEGVGTGRLERMSGGMFGVGLVTNVREAYRFLIFNYDPGDEIFVFGFSRGAYSARTFVGFVRHVGPLRRLHAARIDEALRLYQRRLKGADGSGDEMRRFRATYSTGVCIGPEDDVWRCTNVPGYQRGSSPLLTVRYLGVWDTVGALGVPPAIPFNNIINRKHRFHDTDLTKFVESGRHAVAIDERRSLFPVTLWHNIDDLNIAKGFDPKDPAAPYQERWFPGVHGSVGGGGDIRGLSDAALAWVLKGAKAAGLRLDVEYGTRIHGFNPDPAAPLINVKKPGFSATQLLKTHRRGPASITQLSASAIRRWHIIPDKLPEKKAYRPRTLDSVATALEAEPAWKPELQGDILTSHTVVPGDHLSKLARDYYRDPELWPAIFAANRDILDDPDELFVGMELRIPSAKVGNGTLPDAKTIGPA